MLALTHHVCVCVLLLLLLLCILFVFVDISVHAVAAEGKYIAFVSMITKRKDVTLEDGSVNAAVAQAELKPGLKWLGKVGLAQSSI